MDVEIKAQLDRIEEKLDAISQVFAFAEQFAAQVQDMLPGLNTGSGAINMITIPD